MTIKLLTEHHSEFLHVNGGCKGSSASILVKMPLSFVNKYSQVQLLDRSIPFMEYISVSKERKQNIKKD